MNADFVLYMGEAERATSSAAVVGFKKRYAHDALPSESYFDIGSLDRQANI